MSKQILYQSNARKVLAKGVDTLAKAISITLGPKGRNVVLESKSGPPHIVNDGVTIAKEIELKNPLENIGVYLVRQAALKTNSVVGDGTTTATVLAHAIIKEGLKSIASGSNPVLIKKGIEKAVRFVVNKISECARPVLDTIDIISIASISAGNNIMVGQTIASALEKVGREGTISLEEGQTLSTSLHVTDGMTFNKGYMSPYFLTTPSQTEIVQNNALVLLTDIKITSVQQEIVPILEKVALTNRPLLILVEEVEKEVLSTLILNKIKGIVEVVSVRIPGFGKSKDAFLEDLAVLTNGIVVSDKLGLSLENISLDIMGSAERIIISQDKTTIIAHKNRKNVLLHCNRLKRRIELSSNAYERQQLQDRLSKLSGGVAVIKVGATTSTEMMDNKLRFEDALNATKAAIEEGVVPGGGSALFHLSHYLDLWSKKYLTGDELLGAKIIVRALLIPLSIIAKSTGSDEFTIMNNLNNTNFEIGYDANCLKTIDMYSAGIVDPVKVTRLALQNASSIASIILTTECIVSD